MQHEDWIELAEFKIEEEITNIKENIAHGGARDYAEYKEKCGIRWGLESALNVLQEVKRKIEKDEE
jgi:hypothetical protein